MRYADDIHSDAKKAFEKRVGDTIQSGSVIDMLLNAISGEEEKVYQKIDANRTPHIWTSLSGDNLDKTGFMVNCPRKTGESDENYRYRLLRWVLKSEASNESAISDELLLPTYASNIQFIPLTKGCGTATCYVIPKDYDENTIALALTEAKEKVEKIASPSLYVEYVTPQVLGVKLQIYLTTNNGAVKTIQKNLEEKITNYINNLAPNDYLKVGEINRIGINEQDVTYFSVLSVMIDGESVDSLEILQGLDTKLLFDEIIWSGEE